MKIVLAISHSFSANFLKGQAQFLYSRGHEVIIVSPNGPEISDLILTEKARHYAIPFEREISVTNDLRSFFKIIYFLMKEKPDLVNAGNPKTGFLFMLAGVFFPKIHMVFTLRGLRSDTLKGLKKWIVRTTEKISCYFSEKVIVISPSLSEHAINAGILSRKKAVILGQGSSNGVDTNKYYNSHEIRKQGREFRKSLGIEVEDFVIGYAGRITKDKGVEELYRAFKECQRKYSFIKLVLAGPIEDGDPVDFRIIDQLKNDKNVFMLGKQIELTKIYSAYDLLALYSYREGFGNVVVEASSMGLPTIVSDIPGLKDTTEHMKSGMVVVPKDYKALADAIFYYIENKESRLRHGAYGSQRIRKFFKSEKIWNLQLELYCVLVNNEHSKNHK